jgi:prepilin-type N-terminal cleavage/methylation domain-containing protein
MQASMLRSAVVRRTVFRRGLSPKRRGFTLVEMLIAMALTLIMVYAIAEFYAYVGDTVRDGRAMIEMGGQLRAASQRLKRDLDSLTVRVVPWTDDGNNSGYFEYYEGPRSDKFPDGATLITTISPAEATNLVGDADDILAFTINSGDEPFQGRNGLGTVTSRQAEVVWWTGFKDTDNNGVYNIGEPRFLFRRQLLIVPNPGQVAGPFSSIDDARNQLVAYWQDHDISARVFRDENDGQYYIRQNTLADLTRREHRFAHIYKASGGMSDPEGYPGPIELQAGHLHSRYMLTAAVGEDIMLSNLLAFDVRAFDPTAQLLADTNSASSATVAVGPGDVGYLNAATSGNTVLGFGAYVDLFYNRLENTGRTSTFSGAPNPLAKLYDGEGGIPAGTNYGATYDTWSLSYERGTPGNGRAMNGLDDVVDGMANGDVDDPGERVTSPPYPVPLRGVQVKIRMYDPSSRQVRQATVVADFVSE